mmetsp:Transcript_44215/g.96185  ORF Transcript_44215/g.96185 Transcript_44215/m.96185 type:complete len:141 (-) Transcript_44215:265-687(-)
MREGSMKSAWTSTDDSDRKNNRSTSFVSLSSMLSIWTAGWRSAGSASHGSSSACRPCAHENRHQHFDTKRCINGAFCNFCHDDHVQITRQKRMENRIFKKQQKNDQQSRDRRDQQRLPEDGDTSPQTLCSFDNAQVGRAP